MENFKLDIEVELSQGVADSDSNIDQAVNDMLNDPENLLTYINQKRQDTEEKKEQPAWSDQLLEPAQNHHGDYSKLNKSHAFTEKNNAKKDFDTDKNDDII